MEKPFFCISFFDGDLSWVESVCGENYVVYAKGRLPVDAPKHIVQIPNVGYNIASYLTYIIDNYDDLPQVLVFCKNNVFDRHVSREVFESACRRKVFTPIEDPGRWKKIGFPVSMISSDGGFLELNNSWYVSGYERRYFQDFDEYYQYIFEGACRPEYLRFAPGANYVVPRDHLLLRSRNFYINLREFVIHAQYSCESHFVERSLPAIWSSPLKESQAMSKALGAKELDALASSCVDRMQRQKPFIAKIRRGAMVRIARFVYRIFGPTGHM